MGKKQKQQLPRFMPLLFGNYFGMFGWGLFAPLFAIVVQDNGGDAASVGLIWGFYTLLVGIAMIIFGKIEDKTHRLKSTLVIGSTLLFVGSIGYLFVDSLVQIAIVQSVFAIGFGMLIPSMKTLYMKLEYRGKEAAEWAYMDGGNMLVMSAAAVIGGYIVKNYGLSLLFIVMAFVQLIGTFVLLQAVRVSGKTK